MTTQALSSAMVMGRSMRLMVSFLNKDVPALAVASRWESSLPSLKTEKINENIQLKTIQDTSTAPRPLVLLFGWMLAKQRHLDKYGNMYHSKGFDVLSIQMRPSQVLIPQRAQNTVEHLLSVLQDSSLTQRPIMVHGFSVGGYMYGEFLVKLDDHREKYQGVRSRMVGQVFDSPVDFEGVAPGFASVLSENKFAQKAIKNSLQGYLRLFKKSITSHYLKSSAAFHNNDLQLPSLMLYSRADPIGVDTKIEQVMKKWKASGIPVMARCWESSPHVSHFHRHPDEYVEAVLRFLDSIRLTKPESAKVATRKDIKTHKEVKQAL